MSDSIEADKNVWPDTLRIRDTRLHDDAGGLGQRIYTTAGQGYEKREYVRGDLVEALRAQVADDAIRIALDNAGIDRREAESIELVELRAKLADLQAWALKHKATVDRLDKERIELAKMLLHYVRSVPLGNQTHMSAEIAEKMALVALDKSRA